MAAPVTHIVLTNKIYEKYFSDFEKKSFYVGTSFPDIRYLGSIGREKTHLDSLKMKDIRKESAFVAGLKFHAYLDEVREKLVLIHRLYEKIPDSPYAPQALKFLEDRVLYDKIDDWSIYSSYFGEVLEEAMNMGVPLEDIKRWNNLLVDYFSRKPDAESVANFVRDIGRPPTMSQEINEIVDEIDSKKELLEFIKKLYDTFESML